MADTASLGPWIRRFLLEHIVGERNLAGSTQRSYRDTLRLLLPFVAKRAKKKVDHLEIEDLSADIIRVFLRELEEGRKCSAATRNQRLAALRSFSHFVGLHSPEHVAWCGETRTIPFKRAPRPLVTYLEKNEMDALLAAPTITTSMGRRDHALLLFLYNTGARADEVAHVLIADLHLALTPTRDPASVLIRGKGNKLRRCPLWGRTAAELQPLVNGRGPHEHTFLNRYRQPLTRFGIHAIVERYAERASASVPSLAAKRVGPHVIRHTTATHLLRAGVDINTIRSWLGHVMLATTNVYAEVDLEMKAKALATCEIKSPRTRRRWRQDPDIMEFLQTL
jgi:integrase/recombinase XerD